MPINKGLDKDVVHIHGGILFSHRKNEVNPFAETYTDLQHAVPSEVSQREKKKYGILTQTCGIYKKGTDESISKSEIKTQTQRTNVWAPRGSGERDELGEWG